MNKGIISKIFVVGIVFSIIAFGTVGYCETYWDAYKNVFGGDLAKKYPNAGTSKIECEKMLSEYIRNFSTLNKKCFNVTVDGRVKQICSAPDFQQAGVRSAISQIYCDPNVRKQLAIKEYKGYHDLDNKEGFWIPKGIVPLMMTNEELEKYRIMDENYHPTYNMDSSLMQKKIKKVKELGRPLIRQDIDEVQKDYKIIQNLEEALRDSGATGYTVYNQRGSASSGLPSLSQEEEIKLKYIINEYGDTVLSDNFKKSLSLYRQRQEYLKNNTPKTIQNVQKIQNFYNKYLMY